MSNDDAVTPGELLESLTAALTHRFGDGSVPDQGFTWGLGDRDFELVVDQSWPSRLDCTVLDITDEGTVLARVAVRFEVLP